MNREYVGRERKCPSTTTSASYACAITLGATSAALLPARYLRFLMPDAVSRKRSAARVEFIGSAPYKLFRYDEDYRYLKDPKAHSDIWDPVKYIPVGSDSGQWLTLGGELRGAL